MATRTLVAGAATTVNTATAGQVKIDGAATDVAAAGAQMVYLHNGTTYILSTGRVFVGPEDPVADGFTLGNGDEWINPT